MKYLCLGYFELHGWNALTDADRKLLIEESAAYDAVLRQSGHYIDGRKVRGWSGGDIGATTLRFDNGQVFVTAGPVAETKEPLGGVLILRASDLNHAIQLLSQLPCMRPGGCIEIRPIEDDDTDHRNLT
jgi:hypothetical protein